jgi:DNA-binding response OmpR family regulator
MEELILIAGADQTEVASLKQVLHRDYRVDTLLAPARFAADPRKYSFILLDQNFTEFKSLDTLMQVLNGNEIPVMIMCRNDSSRDVIEALNMGASNFLIKQGDYTQMLSLKVRHVIDTYGEIRTLKEKITALKSRVKDLEEQLAKTNLPKSYVIRDEDIPRYRC